MKLFAASLLTLGLLAGAAHANERTAQTVFSDIASTAPRSVFDDIRDSAPRSVFDDIRDSAPRSDGVFGELERRAP